MEMGVFEALPMDGSPITAASLSAILGVEKELLGSSKFNRVYMETGWLIPNTVRFMRNVTVVGPFEEVGREEYVHTPYSHIYMSPPSKFFLKRCMYPESFELARVRVIVTLQSIGLMSSLPLMPRCTNFSEKMG